MAETRCARASCASAPWLQGGDRGRGHRGHMLTGPARGHGGPARAGRRVPSAPPARRTRYPPPPPPPPPAPPRRRPAAGLRLRRAPSRAGLPPPGPSRAGRGRRGPPHPPPRRPRGRPRPPQRGRGRCSDRQRLLRPAAARREPGPSSKPRSHDFRRRGRGTGAAGRPGRKPRRRLRPVHDERWAGVSRGEEGARLAPPGPRENSDSTFWKRSFDNGKGEVSGVLTSSSGTREMVTYRLVKEGGVWKISDIEFAGQSST